MHPKPGERSKQDYLKEVIRVNQAGEYGAKRIYEGQLAVLKNKACYPTIKHMAEQEEEHLQAFNKMMQEQRVRPTFMTPIWHVAGFALGAGTALLGERAAMACTVAVESVIEKHYAEQLKKLDEDEQALKATIKQFRDEEIEHHDIGLEKEAEQTPFYELLNGAIQSATRFAIAVSKRI